MIGFLASRFIKDYQNTSDAAVRRAYGVLCGAVGIVINLLLFALKLFAGTLAGSVAVTADAFNNLSDAGASIVTLLGFRLAGQKPDPEHPFGHGRLEYISGLIVSMVILLMGIELAKSAVEKILHPEAVEFTLLTGGILLAHETGKALGTRAIFTERVDGKMTFRRGFHLHPGERCLIVEDIVTTGGSIKEVIDVVKANGGIPVAVSMLVDRSGGKVNFGDVPCTALLHLNVETYKPEDCPLCKQGIPMTKRGSTGKK